MIKGSFHQGDITIINVYLPDIGTPKYTKHHSTDLKAEIGSNARIVEDFNIPRSTMDRIIRWEINKDIRGLN